MSSGVFALVFSLISAVSLAVAFLPILRMLLAFVAVFAVVAAEVFAALTAAAFKALDAFLGCQSSSWHDLFSFPSSKYLPITQPTNIAATPAPRNNNSWRQLSGVHNATAMPAMISNAPIVFLVFIFLVICISNLLLLVC